MPLSIRKEGQSDTGKGEFVAVDITFGSSYPTGGEPINARDCKFRVGSLLLEVNMALSGFLVRYLPDSTLKDRGTLQVFEEQGASGKLQEVGNGTDLSAETGRALCFGR